MNKKIGIYIIIGLVICILGTNTQAQQSGNIKLDSDGDCILDDGDFSGVAGDYPCTGGETENCDDNCRFTYNPNQADNDSDGIGNVCCCKYDGGDANGSGAVNVLDVTFLISYLYKDGPEPPCLDEGSANGDCVINILDIVYIIKYLYTAGPPCYCGCVEQDI